WPFRRCRGRSWPAFRREEAVVWALRLPLPAEGVVKPELALVVSGLQEGRRCQGHASAAPYSALDDVADHAAAAEVQRRAAQRVRELRRGQRDRGQVPVELCELRIRQGDVRARVCGARGFECRVTERLEGRRLV